RKNCQGCARSKMSGICPAVQGSKSLDLGLILVLGGGRIAGWRGCGTHISIVRFGAVILGGAVGETGAHPFRGS
ncbi:MAG: hypothetical protein P4N59_05135, partial [Negativicutes bacterium]|nr:hypothetical protein [Negativicutes bacterium]